jgi:exopolyphosphatase/guanosine-5'-triphosphate,3'-diphosphate pyrophosphatase
VAYGSSGTVGAIGDILAAAGWPSGNISRSGLDWVQAQLLKAQTADKLSLEGMKDDRRAVLAGGLSVLRAIVDLLDIEEIQVAQGALRHGALYDLLDREHSQTDLRSSSVNRLSLKFNADASQVQRVGKVAALLFRQVANDFSREECDRHLRKLAWAVQLHEIGSAISHSDYHKHGAYILDNADAAGFSMPELHRLGLLVLGHRGKLRKLAIDFEDDVFVRQLLCLRLAVILCHARRDPALQGIQLRHNKEHEFALNCRTVWTTAYPQSAHLLREESLAWQKTPWTLLLEAT